MMSAALFSNSGSLLALYRSKRCGCRRACASMRCTLDLLTPISAASLRTDQCVLPSCGFCCTFRHTLACTDGVANRGLLPLCFASSPSIPDSSNRCFQREIVRAVLCNSRCTASYVFPSASARIKRARNTSPAGNVRDCDHRINSSLCSAVRKNNSRYPATYYRRKLTRKLS
jgi:hypothetical protein